MKSKYGGHFRKILSELETLPTTESEAFVRDLMASVVAYCPLPLLIQLGRQTVDYNDKEWKQFTEQN